MPSTEHEPHTVVEDVPNVVFFKEGLFAECQGMSDARKRGQQAPEQGLNRATTGPEQGQNMSVKE